MSVPKLKVTILRDNDAVQKAWLEVKDHGHDLRLYSPEPKANYYKWEVLMGCQCCERIDLQKITHWMPLPPKPEAV